ncbi:uncharacterized protein LOC120090854 [Benincasa hispida]|uniref:uncharacterized protein LOC120090854 n=1 Tax=Benincasa hispida TaxID=102211 RepID=UPI0019009457|nr:uncharacterized protein LOC120090854 [Benincasa hispida]
MVNTGSGTNTFDKRMIRLKQKANQRWYVNLDVSSARADILDASVEESSFNDLAWTHLGLISHPRPESVVDSIIAPDATNPTDVVDTDLADDVAHDNSPTMSSLVSSALCTSDQVVVSSTSVNSNGGHSISGSSSTEGIVTPPKKKSPDFDFDPSMQIYVFSNEEDIAFIKNKTRKRVGRHKITPNVPSMHIDGISFHSEDNVLRWKYVMQQRIANENVLSNQTKSCLKIMDLLQRVELLKTIVDLDAFYSQLMREFIIILPSKFNDPRYVDFPPFDEPHPFTEDLVVELTGGTRSEWPSFVSSSPTSLLYQIGTLSTFDFESPAILGPNDALSPAPKFLNLSYKIFQGTRVPDIVHNIHPPKSSDIPLPEDLQVPKGGLLIPTELRTRIFHSSF